MWRFTRFPSEFGEECSCCRFTTSFGQHEIKGFSASIDRTIEIHPAAFDLHLGLIHPPGLTGCCLPTMSLRDNCSRKSFDPSIECCVNPRAAAFSHLFGIAV